MRNFCTEVESDKYYGSRFSIYNNQLCQNSSTVLNFELAMAFVKIETDNFYCIYTGATRDAICCLRTSKKHGPHCGQSLRTVIALATGMKPSILHRLYLKTGDNGHLHVVDFSQLSSSIHESILSKSSTCRTQILFLAPCFHSW